MEGRESGACAGWKQILLFVFALAQQFCVPATVGFLQVDSRLNGDGTGKVLGIDAGLEAVALLGVFTLVWSLYYSSQRDLDNGRNDTDDSGLSL